MSDWITWHAPYTGWLVTLLCAVLGTALTILGLRRRPNRTDTGHCARCGYDLRGTTGERCSECGGAVGDTAPPLPRRWRWAIVGVVLATALPVAVVAKRVNEYGLQYYGYYGPLYWVLPDETFEELAHGKYVVRVSRDRYPYSSNDRSLTIWHHGQRVYQRHGWYFTLGLCDAATPLGPVADLDHDGTDELIVQQSDGGNGGSYQTIICSLAEDPAKRKLLLLPGDLVIDGSKPADNNGRLLTARVPFRFRGQMHSIWKDVVLRYDAGLVAFVADAMRREPPYSPTELAALADRVRPKPNGNGKLAAFDEFLVADAMLDLVFAGHAAEAYTLPDRIWPDDSPAKQQFIGQFRQRLSESPARAVLTDLGHPPLDPPTPRDTVSRYGN